MITEFWRYHKGILALLQRNFGVIMMEFGRYYNGIWMLLQENFGVSIKVFWEKEKSWSILKV